MLPSHSEESGREIIVREGTIFGILGVATLGWHVDAAISELRFDVAVVLILGSPTRRPAERRRSRCSRRRLLS